MHITIETDEQHEGARSLEMLYQELSKVHRDMYAWKWAILALHSAVQNFIVCAISGTDQTGALKEEDRKKWLEHYEKKLGPPEVKLATFLILFERMKKLTGFHEKVDADMANLNDFRNDFIHYTPKGWTIHAEGLPEIFLRCLKIVEFLGWNPGKIHWYEDDDRLVAQRSYELCVVLLNSLNQEYKKKVA